MNRKQTKEEAYRLARARYLAREPQAMKEAGERDPRREELREPKVFVGPHVVSK